MGFGVLNVGEAMKEDHGRNVGHLDIETIESDIPGSIINSIKGLREIPKYSCLVWVPYCIDGGRVKGSQVQSAAQSEKLWHHYSLFIHSKKTITLLVQWLDSKKINQSNHKDMPPDRFELSAFALQVQRSTPEL